MSCKAEKNRIYLVEELMLRFIFSRVGEAQLVEPAPLLSQGYQSMFLEFFFFTPLEQRGGNSLSRHGTCLT